MKIAILGAMPEEIDPFIVEIPTQIDYYAGNKFYKAEFTGHELFIAYSKIGKVNAAITATLLIEKFKVEALLFTGVAGALKDNFKIGELLYATKLAQHDLDISAFGHPVGYVPGNEIFVNTSKKLNKIAVKTAKDLGLTLKSGVIASGDQFICDDDKKAWIAKTFGADAVEMEGASVAQVCSAFKVPFFIMRAISDVAGHKAEIDYDEFMENSAKTSADFVLKMIEKI